MVWSLDIAARCIDGPVLLDIGRSPHRVHLRGCDGVWRLAGYDADGIGRIETVVLADHEDPLAPVVRILGGCGVAEADIGYALAYLCAIGPDRATWTDFAMGFAGRPRVSDPQDIIGHIAHDIGWQARLIYGRHLDVDGAPAPACAA